MRKLSRALFSSAAVALVSLALATTPASALACFPAYIIAFDELECRDFCHGRGCNYYFYPDSGECVCKNP